MMNRVVVAGSLNMDIVATAERRPEAGETVSGETLSFFPGGKGANQAVSAARLGASTYMLGKVGADSFGRDLTDFLKGEGVALDFLQASTGQTTGTALIVVDEKGENSIVVIPGANGTVEPKDIEAFTFMPGDVLVGQFEIPVPAVEAFFEKGKAQGAITVFNPAPAKKLTPSLQKNIDYLIVNETELAFLLDGQDMPLEDAARALRAHEAQTVIVTLGKDGVFALKGEDVLSVPGHVVQAVDTTGAGDCFVGALASCLARDIDFSEALVFANKAASLCVQRPGAGPSMPKLAEM